MSGCFDFLSFLNSCGCGIRQQMTRCKQLTLLGFMEKLNGWRSQHVLKKVAWLPNIVFLLVGCNRKECWTPNAKKDARIVYLEIRVADVEQWPGSTLNRDRMPKWPVITDGNNWTACQLYIATGGHLPTGETPVTKELSSSASRVCCWNKVENWKDQRSYFICRRSKSRAGKGRVGAVLYHLTSTCLSHHVPHSLFHY